MVRAVSTTTTSTSPNQQHHYYALSSNQNNNNNKNDDDANNNDNDNSNSNSIHDEDDDVMLQQPHSEVELSSSPFKILPGENVQQQNERQQQQQKQKERQWAMMLFSLTTVLLFADQNLMAPNLSDIASDFGFDDEERDVKLGGHIALAFWMLGAPAGFVVGVLADRMNRTFLFAVTVGIGEGACFLTYWTTTYWELYICRAVTGFSIGGALPLIYSILGDLFSADERHKVNAAVGIGTGMGTSVGQGVAGFLGPTFGWRLPFLIVSVPALLCAAIVYKTVEDPERGQTEEAVLEYRRSILTTNDDDDDDDDKNNNNATLNDHSEYSYSDGVLAIQTTLEMQQFNYGNKEHDTSQCSGENIRLTKSTPLSSSSSSSTSTTPPPPPPPRSSLKGVRRRSRSLGRKSPQDDADQDDRNERDTLRFSIAKQNFLQTFYHRQIEPVAKSSLLLLKTPTVVLALLQGAPGCLPWGIVNTYLNDFLAEDRGMSVEFATFTILWFGAGNFLGMLAGGAGGQYLYRVDKRYPALLAGSMAIFGCVPFWVLLNGVNNNSSFIFIASVSLIAGAAAAVTGPIVKATLQNVTLPTQRGQAFAFYNTFDDFGRGLGPVFVAHLITSLGGRTPAFNLGTLGWIMCGVLNLLIFFTVDADERRIQATISATLSQRDHSNVLC